MDIETRRWDRKKRDGSEKEISNMRSLRVWGEDWGTEGLKSGKVRRFHM